MAFRLDSPLSFVQADKNGNIEVSVLDPGGGAEYTAVITDGPNGSGSTGGPVASLTAQDSSSNRYYGFVPVGDLDASKVLYVTIYSANGESQSYPIRVVRSSYILAAGAAEAGPGLVEPGEKAEKKPAAKKAVEARPGVALASPADKYLLPFAGVTEGDCSDCPNLNGQTIRLVYFESSFGLPGRWFSDCVAICSDKDHPAGWMLEKKDTGENILWILTLRRGSSTIAAYSGITMSVEPSAKLKKIREDKKTCDTWPDAVTIIDVP